jgi:hypothetical protein
LVQRQTSHHPNDAEVFIELLLMPLTTNYL